jgi:hypothetical protein
VSNVIQLPYYTLRDIEPVCADLRAGRGAFILLGDSPTAFIEVAGPKGLPSWWFLCNAAYPQLSLRTSYEAPPLAVAEANRAFPGGLDEIAAKAEPLIGEAATGLRALLAAVREATATMRFRVPTVAEVVTEEGQPSFAAWASCLPLGVLQRCLDRSRRSRAA